MNKLHIFKNSILCTQCARADGYVHNNVYMYIYIYIYIYIHTYIHTHIHKIWHMDCLFTQQTRIRYAVYMHVV
jgi:hypothetical protein